MFCLKVPFSYGLDEFLDDLQVSSGMKWRRLIRNGLIFPEILCLIRLWCKIPGQAGDDGGVGASADGRKFVNNFVDNSQIFCNFAPYCPIYEKTSDICSVCIFLL